MRKNTTRRFFCSCLASAPMFAATAAMAAEPHGGFGYEGAHGPEHWGTLNQQWGTCSAGRNQSPVDLAQLVDADLAPLSFDFGATASEWVNTGHALQANFRPGAGLTVDGQRFELRQFHFHTPSEHKLEGRPFPLEAHLVHQGPNGALAVVGVLFEAGGSNALLGLLGASLPARPGATVPLPEGLTAEGLLPADRTYLRYSGSLTTPPCSEGVRWIVMREPMRASEAQIRALRDGLGFANARPAQPLWARVPLR